MRKVERHLSTFNAEKKIETLSELVNTDLEGIHSEDLYCLVTLGGDVGKLIRLYLFSEQNKGTYRSLFQFDLRHYIRLCVDASIVPFRLASTPGRTMEIVLQEEKFIFTGSELSVGIDTGDWMRAFAWTVILRDSDALNRLLEFPESIMRKSQMKGDEYRFLYVDFLKSMYVDADLAKQKLMKAYKAAAPENLHIEKPFFALNDASPELELYASLLSNNKKEFNENLFKALQCHKEVVRYCNGESQPDFLINLDITAIAALAFDNGFPIEVESDYMPRFLVEGKFIKP